MIDGQRIVAIVPARSGSKSIPGKNLAQVGGISLLARAIQAARVCGYIDRIIVSTDGDAIAAAAQHEGAEVMFRSQALASDTALVKDVLIDIANRMSEQGEAAQIMVLLEPTACLRNSTDIDLCLEKMVADHLDSVATFTEADPHPHRIWQIDDNGRPSTFINNVVPWMPRQSLAPAFRLNGCVYAFNIDVMINETGPQILVGKTGAIVMSADRSIDIDNPVDLEIANALVNKT